ncbi:MAG: glycosyltransferase family 39 protein [Lachnospiraceae bacterium]|nr:glycosyltransferase family 39 protein [Lachnospiraceae bacterium]
MKKGYFIKTMQIILVLIVLGAALFVLNHTVKNGRETQTMLPTVMDTPVYVECNENTELTVSMQAKEDFHVGGFQLLLVNISEESKGTLHLTLKDSSGNLYMDQVIPVDTIVPGEWFQVSADAVFTAGEEYVFTMTADGSEPYFMQLSREEMNEVLPVEVTVKQDGVEVDSGISFGVDVVTEAKVTFGDIFYYSVPLVVLAAVVCILLILFGKEKMVSMVQKIPFAEFFAKYGNDLFLILLFISICVSIYARAYVKGVYITSDSAGYLREAVNLVHGNGFAYDGLAGYDSWFANWPILYPAMIAAVMFVTQTNAYLASKILSMLLVGIILVILRCRFGKEAWVYSLCLTNIGFLNLTYYTWSEIPFMVVLLCFGLVFAKILKEENPSVKWYVFLGLTGFGCFMTRYYGAYVWIVIGLYLLLFIKQYLEKKDKVILKKGICITVTAFVSGCLSFGYLLMNKVMNGMASGVSRTLWWDDYEKLTNDLIGSLLTEIFNIFSLQVPQIIDNCPYSMKVWFLVIVLVGLAWFIKANCKHFSTESVMITLAVSYYIIFIGIRYVSSMDTFYFRFFEPATFILSIGLVGLILPYLRDRKGFHYFAAVVTTVMCMAVISLFQNGSMETENSYYSSLTKQWDDAYADIPEKSVVIFSNIDFRASWYRPDVVEGEILPENTYADLQNIYAGSDYMCVRAEDAATMVEEGDYDKSVKDVLQQGLEEKSADSEYIVINLR